MRPWPPGAHGLPTAEATTAALRRNTRTARPLYGEALLDLLVDHLSVELDFEGDALELASVDIEGAGVEGACVEGGLEFLGGIE